MATQPDQHPEPRAPLTRERVLRTALTIADEGGIESLSMRKLGQELGVEAMSLYHHVANKDDIIDGITETVLEEIEDPSWEGDWKAEIRRTAISSHEVFLRHRWACSLMMHRPRVSPARLGWMEALLRTLREAGFSADMTHHAYHALDSHITGFTLWQVNMPFETKAELVDLAEGFLREIPADEYPYIIEHAEQHLAPSSPDGATEFEFGLDLILDGLERLRDAEAATPE
jgi:AcrR family transcriptional regulator